MKHRFDPYKKTRSAVESMQTFRDPLVRKLGYHSDVYDWDLGCCPCDFVLDIADSAEICSRVAELLPAPFVVIFFGALRRAEYEARNGMNPKRRLAFAHIRREADRVFTSVPIEIAPSSDQTILMRLNDADIREHASKWLWLNITFAVMHDEYTGRVDRCACNETFAKYWNRLKT